MLFFLNEKCTIKEIPKEIETIVKQELTISNPLFNLRFEMGLANWGIPQSLIYYKYDTDSIIVPIGIVPKLLSILKSKNYLIDKDNIIDNRFINTQMEYFSNLNFTGELRSYQNDVVNKCLEKSMGVIDAMTGSGKTICFIALTLKRQEPTLILVNTIELANQTIASFLKFSNLKQEDIGFIGSGKFDLKTITIGLHQTMAKLTDEKINSINNLFSQIISDEVHIIAAETYYNTLSKLKAKYKFGFSATPFRTDGLTDVIHFATGPTIYTVPKEELADVLITPNIKIINTDYFFPLFSTQEYQNMISDLSENQERNILIKNTLLNNYKDNYVCLLCQRVSQVEILHQMLGDKSVPLISKMTKKLRKKTIEQLNNKTKQYIISTFGLFAQGIDIPHLDVLFICAPLKSEIKVKQAAGRLMRMAENKTTATIVDFVDIKVELLKYSFYKRQRIYKKL